MTNGESPSNFTLQNAKLEIARLDDARIALLNRSGAIDAMINSLLEVLSVDALRRMEQRYDLRKVNAMEHMDPGTYKPHLWEPYTEKLREVIALRLRTPPPEQS